MFKFLYIIKIYIVSKFEYDFKKYSIDYFQIAVSKIEIVRIFANY
jgi:hypothetical protein